MMDKGQYFFHQWGRILKLVKFFLVPVILPFQPSVSGAAKKKIRNPEEKSRKFFTLGFSKRKYSRKMPADQKNNPLCVLFLSSE